MYVAVKGGEKAIAAAHALQAKNAGARRKMRNSLLSKSANNLPGPLTE